MRIRAQKNEYTASREAAKRIAGDAWRLPLGRALAALHANMWVIERRAQGIESTELHAFVTALCSRHDWIFVRSLAESLEHLIRAGKRRVMLPVFKQWMRLHVVPVLESHLPLSLIGEADWLDSFLSNRDVSWQQMWQVGYTYALDMAPHPCLISVGQLMMLGKNINRLPGWQADQYPTQFCEFCWRLKQRSGKYCTVHSTSQGNEGSRQEAGNILWNWVANGDYYRYSHSLREAFESSLRQVQRMDQRNKAKSSWHAAIGEGWLRVWLAQHRRTVYMAIGHALGEPSEDTDGELELLLTLLDTSPSDGPFQAERRKIFHRTLAADRPTIFEMLQRVEAWLLAAQTRRKKWGGATVVKLRG